MDLTPLEKDVLVMDDKKKAIKRIQIQRAFAYSRLGTEFISAAYESLVPIQRIVLSEGPIQTFHDMKEARKWAM
jgi:hypothetical protein